MSWKALLIAAACAIALAGCGKDEHADHAKAKAQTGEHEDEDVVKLSDAEAARAGIRSEALEEQELADALSLTATIQANPERLAHVAPRLPGRVVAVMAKLGDVVKQGETLATLESIEIGEAYAAWAQAEAEAKVARAAYERAERLHADQIIPGKEYQQARGTHEKTRAQAQAAEQKLRLLGVSPAQISEGTVSRFPVAAPLSGSVIDRKAVIGELAKPEEALFTVADLSRVWLEANVGEADLGRVRPGSVARARFAAYPDDVFEGKVSHVGATLDKETRTARAIVELANPKGFLRPHMFGNVAIETGSARKVLALPESAVTLIQGLPTVFVEESAGFRPHPIEVAGRAGGRVIVKSGVEAGDLVVTEGVYALKARALKSQIGSGHAH
jgi:cobalt-zinc-cadmium efflux system membrane fusion protein